MQAKMFFKLYNMICNGNCSSCKLGSKNNKYNLSCTDFIRTYVDEAENLLKEEFKNIRGV